MSAREIQDQKTIASEVFVQHGRADAQVLTSPPPSETICPTESGREYTLESTVEDGFYEPADTPLPPVTRVDAANLMRTLQHLEAIAKRQGYGYGNRADLPNPQGPK